MSSSVRRGWSSDVPSVVRQPFQQKVQASLNFSLIGVSGDSAAGAKWCKSTSKSCSFVNWWWLCRCCGIHTKTLKKSGCAVNWSQ